MTDSECDQTPRSNWLSCHKQTMRAINKEACCPVLFKHLVVESFASMKVYQEEGAAHERSEMAAKCITEILRHEKHLSKDSGKVVMLAVRNGRWYKDLNDQIVMESRGHEEDHRTFQGDGEADDSVPTVMIPSAATASGDTLTVNVLFNQNVHVIKEQIDMGVTFVKQRFC